MNNKRIVVFLFLALLTISLNDKTTSNAADLCTNIQKSYNDVHTIIKTTGNTTVVTPTAISNHGTGKYALSIYNNFDLGKNDTAIMVIPTGVKYYINRCDSNTGININGTLESRLGGQTGNIGGHLIFISPKGINIGSGATINTGSLTLSTASSTKIKDQNGNYLKDQYNNDLDLNTLSYTGYFGNLNMNSANVIEYGNIASTGSVVNTYARITNKGIINTFTPKDNSETTSVDFVAGAIENKGTIGGDNSVVNFQNIDYSNKTDSVNLIVANKATYSYSTGKYELNEGVADANNTSAKMGSVYLGKDSTTQANQVNISTNSNNPSSSQYGTDSSLEDTAIKIEGSVKSSGDISISSTNGEVYIAGHGILNAGNDVNITSADKIHLGDYIGEETGDPTIYAGNNINISSSDSLSVAAYNTLKAHKDITIEAAESHIGSNGTNSILIDSETGNINITTTGDTNISGNRTIRAQEGSVSITADKIYVSDIGNYYKSAVFGAATDAPTISAKNDITMTGSSSFDGNVYLKSDNGNISIKSDKVGSTIKFDAVRDGHHNPISYAPVLKANKIEINSSKGNVKILDRTKFVADNEIKITGNTGVNTDPGVLIKNERGESQITDALDGYKAGGLCMYTSPNGSIEISSSDDSVSFWSSGSSAVRLNSGNITINAAKDVKLYTDVFSRIDLNALANDISINGNDIYETGYSYLKGRNINLLSNNSTYITNYFNLPQAERFGVQVDDPLIKAQDSINLTSQGNISLQGNDYLLAGADPNATGKISINGKNISFNLVNKATFCDYSILKGKSIELTGSSIKVDERAKMIATNGAITFTADNDIELKNSQFEYESYNYGQKETNPDLYNLGMLDYTGLALVAKGAGGSISLTSNSGNINILTEPDTALNKTPVSVSLISGNNTILMNSQNINDTFKSYKVTDGKLSSEKDLINTGNDSTKDKITDSIAKSTGNLNDGTKMVTTTKTINTGSTDNQQFVALDNGGLLDTNSASDKQVSNDSTGKTSENVQVADKSDNKASDNNSSNKVNAGDTKKEDTRNEQTAQIVQQTTISIKGKKVDNFYGEYFMNSLVKNNSKENEYRADLNAVNESAKMGYHPAGIAGFLISVKSAENRPRERSIVNNSFVYRHPDTSDRLGRIEGEIKGLNSKELHESLINKQEFNNVMSVLKR